MSEREKYIAAFCNAFDVTKEDAVTLKFEQIPAWDSVGHMGLIAELEEAFNIMMETEDIIDLNSFDKGIELLKKYQVVIE